MLLRTTALALLLANGAYLAWSQGWLSPVGLGPSTSSEPQRLQQQIRPEALRVQPSAGAPAPPATAASPAVPAASAAPAVEATACWQAGPFDAAQADALRTALAAAGVPADAWTLEGQAASGRWIVYMGRYPDAESLEKKRAELRALRVDTAPMTQAALAPGLSLGVFSTQEAANEHLAQLARRGVRTARVVPEQREAATSRLRLPAADAARRAQILQLGPALAGRTLTPC